MTNVELNRKVSQKEIQEELLQTVPEETSKCIRNYRLYWLCVNYSGRCTETELLKNNSLMFHLHPIVQIDDKFKSDIVPLLPT